MHSEYGNETLIVVEAAAVRRYARTPELLIVCHTRGGVRLKRSDSNPRRIIHTPESAGEAEAPP